jgi:hypothetical protein
MGLSRVKTNQQPQPTLSARLRSEIEEAGEEKENKKVV